MKYGKEVEGKFKNLYSIFINDTELQDEKVKNYLLTNNNYHQLYISALYWFLRDDDFEFLKELKSKNNILITIETRAVCQELFDKYKDICSFIYVFISTDVFRLRKDDQIKIMHTYDHQKVLAIGLENMYKTLPEDFKNDVEINLEQE